MRFKLTDILMFHIILSGRRFFIPDCTEPVSYTENPDENQL